MSNLPLQPIPLGLPNDSFQITSGGQFLNGGQTLSSGGVSSSQQQYYSNSGLIGGGVVNANSGASGFTFNGMTTEIPTGQRLVTGGQERIQSVRKVSSTIIGEEYVGQMPPSTDMSVKYVEVNDKPERNIVTNIKKRVENITKRVPQIQEVWTEKVVEVPEIIPYPVEKRVEVVQEVRVERKIRQDIDQPYYVTKKREVPRTVTVERKVEVPGEVIKVPKPYRVEQPVDIEKYTDTKTPLVVAQTIKPYIVEGKTVAEIDVYEYVPEVVPIDVHVIKPVQAQIVAAGVTQSMHRVIAVPAAQYNSMLKQLNVHLDATQQTKLPFQKDMYGNVTMISETTQFTYPQVGVEIQGFVKETAVHVHTEEQRGMNAITQHTTEENVVMQHGGMSSGFSMGGTYTGYSGGSTSLLPSQHSSMAPYNLQYYGTTNVLSQQGQENGIIRPMDIGTAY